MNKKTIFLDVDGVLNRIGYGGKELFETELVSNFSTCVKFHDADVVVHSSWREIDEKLDLLKNILHEHGIDIAGVTPYGMNKADSIFTYISKQKIENYVVVDDDNYEYDFPGRFVRTVDYGWVGFTPECALKVGEIMKRVNC